MENKSPQEQINEIEKLTEKFREKFSDKIIDFCKDYNHISVKSFIGFICREIAEAQIYGGRYLRDRDSRLSQYQEMARERLMDIQHRKLFDLNCQWRAEQIKIPGVEVCYHFNYWDEDIKNCPFLTPINDEEFNLYFSFVELSSIEDVSNDNWLLSVDWQDYAGFKYYYTKGQDHNMAEQPPEWYEFYESRTGLSSLYLLPDIRGVKEEIYFKAARQERLKKYEKEQLFFVKDERPYFIYSPDIFKSFISKYMSPDLLKKFLAQEQNKDIYDDEELFEAVETLLNAEFAVPIKAHADWRQAILNAMNYYEKQMLLKELEVVYKEYKFQTSLGISYSSETENILEEILEIHKSDILRGRELLGEPRNFDF